MWVVLWLFQAKKIFDVSLERNDIIIGMWVLIIIIINVCPFLHAEQARMLLGGMEKKRVLSPIGQQPIWIINVIKLFAFKLIVGPLELEITCWSAHNNNIVAPAVRWLVYPIYIGVSYSTSLWFFYQRRRNPHCGDECLQRDLQDNKRISEKKWVIIFS